MNKKSKIEIKPLKWTFGFLFLLIFVLNNAGIVTAQEATPEPPPDAPDPNFPPLGIAAPLNDVDPDIGYHPVTGKVNFIGSNIDLPIANPHFSGLSSGEVVAEMAQAGTLEQAARGFLQQYGTLFGLSNPETDLVLIRETHPNDRRSFVRFQQQYQGVPVFGAELVLQMDAAGNVISANGEILPDIHLSTDPSIPSTSAEQTATQHVTQSYQVPPLDQVIENNGLWIYSPALVSSDDGEPRLVWRIEVSTASVSPLNELVLVDAQTGSVMMHFSQAGAVKYLVTYDAGNGTGVPGTPVCDETDPACTAGDADAKDAHTYASDFYDFFMDYFNRDSIDDNEHPLISTVNYGTAGSVPAAFENGAFWNGSQAIFADAASTIGYSQADDIVGHEFAHGLNDFTAGLFNYYQSGAIAESLSDLWGEFIDQTNSKGSDSPTVKWLIGEDNPGGAVRNMSNPPAKGQPDKMTSALYETDTIDNGGIHTNSGVNNKMVSLLVDGGSFNGESITALGLGKVAAIYYEAQTNLLVSGSDYLDLYNLLYQACTNLFGEQVYGGGTIDINDCTTVRQAANAVEMNLHPTASPTLPFAADPPLCPAGSQPNFIFSDDLEISDANWAYDVVSGSQQWAYKGFKENAHSGLGYLYADNFYSDASSYVMTTFDIPVDTLNGVFLYFYHYLELTNDQGKVEYSTNGVDWLDVGPLPDVNGYNGTSYFTGSSHGYTGTRIDLTSLAGQSNVFFRWLLTTDTDSPDPDADTGWWLDDVQLYVCETVDIEVRIGGILQGTYSLEKDEHRVVRYPVAGGPVVISSNGANIIASELQLRREDITADFWTGIAHLMGVQEERLADKYVFPYYNGTDNTKYQSIQFGNYDTFSTDVSITIGGVLMGTYPLDPNESTTKQYDVTGGPIVISSNNGAKIIASFYELKRPIADGKWWGQSQMMGIPWSELSSTYVFPRYNDTLPGMDATLIFANPSDQTATVTVTIGGVLWGTYATDPDEYHVVRYPVAGGPVVISSNGPDIIASELQLRREDITADFWTGIAHLMGVQEERLADKYVFPYYNGTDHTKYQSIQFGNYDTFSTEVTIMIGGEFMGTYPLDPSESTTKQYDFTGGPIVISSNNGAKIIASFYELKRPITEGKWWGQTQMMGIPWSELSSTYVFPRYNDTLPGMDATLIFAVP